MFTFNLLKNRTTWDFLFEEIFKEHRVGRLGG